MQLSYCFLLLSTATFTWSTPIPQERRATGISAARRSQVIAAFSSSGIVPTLIPSIDPKVDVSVKYGNKAVNLGNQFLTTETLLAPALSFSAEVDRDVTTTKYSYFLVDPDVPSPNGVPAVGLRLNYLHWYVSGASPDTVIGSPQTVAIYQSPTPASPEQHRYTFLVYREPAGYQPDLITPQVRAGFDINAYAKKGGLVLVGGNFLREAITNGIL